MKKLLLPFLVLLLVACKSGKKTETVAGKDPVTMEDAKSIIGKWVVTDAKFDEEMTEEEKKEIIGVATMEFMTDGRYEALASGDDEKGTYTFDSKTNKLIISPEGDEKQELSVEWGDGTIKLINKELSMTFKRFGK